MTTLPPHQYACHALPHACLKSWFRPSGRCRGSPIGLLRDARSMTSRTAGGAQCDSASRSTRARGRTPTPRLCQRVVRTHRPVDRADQHSKIVHGDPGTEARMQFALSGRCPSVNATATTARSATAPTVHLGCSRARQRPAGSRRAREHGVDASAPSPRARRIDAAAASSSNSPQSPPSCHVPNAIRETSRPLRPNVVVFMLFQSHRASAGLGLCGRLPGLRTGESVSLPLIPIGAPW